LNRGMKPRKKNRVNDAGNRELGHPTRGGGFCGKTGVVCSATWGLRSEDQKKKKVYEKFGKCRKMLEKDRARVQTKRSDIDSWGMPRTRRVEKGEGPNRTVGDQEEKKRRKHWGGGVEGSWGGSGLLKACGLGRGKNRDITGCGGLLPAKITKGRRGGERKSKGNVSMKVNRY